MATYDELRQELTNLDGLYGVSGSWRRLLSPADVRAIDGYLGASNAVTRFEQSPTGVWQPTDGSSGQVGYLDPNSNTFYPTVAESHGDTPQVPDVLVGVLRNEYNNALNGGSLTLPADDPFLRTDEQQRGDAAEAIKTLEGAMVLQQNDVADADLRLAEAVMRAHSTAETGNQLLDELQRKIDDYIRANPGLDTPTGAKEFQRFLIGVMDEIAGVVSSGSLDAASLEGIVTSLAETYRVPEQVQAPSTEEPTPAGEVGEPTPVADQADPPTESSPGGQPVAVANEPTLDDLLAAETPLLSDPGVPTETAQMPTSSMPNLGGLGMPSGMSGSSPSPGVGSLPNLFGTNPSEPSSDLLSEEDPLLAEERLGEYPPEPESESEPESDEEEPADEESPGTEVTLPNGETVTAPNAHIASAITAAAGGTPVVEAYRQNGMTITPVGTEVASPVDTADVITGDVGVFSDHHVIALGDSKALVNTSVQPVDDVVGPGFLGWERPPEVEGDGEAQASDEVRAPTRVAAAT